ncbi:MAG: LacI family DNA-binding transcriptional regulator [Candidatus Limnocylindrales bacterium]
MTITDVASLAGVGRGTVSRVLNERANVDPATRARVLAAIKELDFVPSPTARRLSLRRTQTVAVILPFFTRPSAVERLRGIEFALVHARYDLIVFNVETVERRDAVFRDLPRPERVDGMIIVSLSPHESELERIQRSGLPAVLVDAHHRSMTRVVADDVLGGRLAADHLIALGHRRIGFIGDIPRTPLAFTSSRLRLTGVRRALVAAGLQLPTPLIAIGDHSRHRAVELARQMLTHRMPPTGIVCASDTQAAGVLEAAASLGMTVPGDLSVTGYDDLELADHLGLTTIRQPLFESGVRAVQRLLVGLDGGSMAPIREVQDIALVIRRTTAPPVDRGGWARRFAAGDPAVVPITG